MPVKSIVTILLVGFVLQACSDESSSKAVETKTMARVVDPVKYSQGGRLYQVHCASCHGKQAEGAPDWRTPDENGKNKAPPLNGTGHTWHHSDLALVTTIKNGTVKIGGNMPAWKDKLSNDEIMLILTWIKAQWPDEVYAAWYNRFQSKK